MALRPETVERLLWIGSALGFAVAILGAVGEFLGWWNDLGELLITVGTLTGLLLAGFSATAGSSRSQVHDVAAAVHGVATGVGVANDRLVRMDARLYSVDTKLDKLGKLDDLDELSKLDGMDSKLDAVHTVLEAQTGVLERQATILEQVRDRL